MDDALLAGRAVSGDLESFGQLYDQYFPRVYDFAWRTLGDAADAADATRDVLLQAARRLPHGTGGATFRSWLFGLAFNSIIPRAESARATAPAASPLHEEAFGSFEVPDPARVTDPALIGNDYELAALVWEAASSLTARDRAILDLHLRQGLDSAELAPIVGLSKSDAANLIARMKAAATAVMASYLMARRGSQNCDRLAEVLAPFGMPPFTDAARRAVDSHAKDCAICGPARARLIPPLEVFGAFAAARPPMELKGDVWSSIAAGWSDRPIGSAQVEPPPFAGSPIAAAGLSIGGGGDGFHGYPPAAEGWGRNQILWFGGAVAGLIIFAFAAGFIAVNAFGGGDGNGATAGGTRTPTAVDTATAVSSITPGVAVQTATPNLTPSATPVPTETPTLALTDTPVPEPATATPTAKPVVTPTKGAVKSATPTKTPKQSPTSKPTAGATPTP